MCSRSAGGVGTPQKSCHSAGGRQSVTKIRTRSNQHAGATAFTMSITTTIETQTETNNNIDPQAMERLRPNTDGMKPPRLVRSSSLDRIKQFPAYLCNTKLMPQLLNTTVQAGIEQALRLVRGSLLFIAVYVCVFILLVQFSALCFALLTGAMPPGLVFMLASLAVMCGMACKTIGYDSAQHRHISRHHAD